MRRPLRRSGVSRVEERHDVDMELLDTLLGEVTEEEIEDEEMSEDTFREIVGEMFDDAVASSNSSSVHSSVISAISQYVTADALANAERPVDVERPADTEEPAPAERPANAERPVNRLRRRPSAAQETLPAASSREASSQEAPAVPNMEVWKKIWESIAGAKVIMDHMHLFLDGIEKGGLGSLFRCKSLAGVLKAHVEDSINKMYNALIGKGGESLATLMRETVPNCAYCGEDLSNRHMNPYKAGNVGAASCFVCSGCYDNLMEGLGTSTYLEDEDEEFYDVVRRLYVSDDEDDDEDDDDD